MSALSLEEAKAYLKKDSGGVNLYDHLSDLLLKILVEKPENACDAFEHMSTALKQNRFISESSRNNNLTSPAYSNAKTEQEKWCDVATNLFKPPAEEEPQDFQAMQDLIDEANMFEWAGMGFSREETFRLSLALRKLAMSSQAISMRLWGKYIGVSGDYYIAEGELEEKYEPEDPQVEEGGDGANRYTYWAMQDDGSYTWIQLPNVTQAQILAARKLKRFVTGDLNAKVTGNPPFPGVEKHFLRAQIARISSSTVICPNGIFQIEEEEGKIIPAEEPEAKSIDDLVDLGNWVHYIRDLNEVYGRCTPMPTRTNDDGDEVPWDGDVLTEPLRSLSADNNDSWRIYKVPGSISPAVGQVAVVKSLVWPGAVTVGHGLKFLNLYVGHGIKYNPNPFQPQLPAPIQKEFGLTEKGEGDDNTPVWIFENLQEQADVVVDPTPPSEEQEEE